MTEGDPEHRLRSRLSRLQITRASLEQGTRIGESIGWIRVRQKLSNYTARAQQLFNNCRTIAQIGRHPYGGAVDFRNSPGVGEIEAGREFGPLPGSGAVGHRRSFG
jgi:hypothetical protein